MKCNLCNNERVKILYNVTDITIEKCLVCGMVFQNPLIPKHLKKTKDYYDDEELNMQLLIDNMKKDADERLRSLLKFRTQGTLFDVGCGFGYFIKEAGKHFNCNGLELSKIAANYARVLCDVDIINNDLDSFVERDQYDVVTMYHIIEHIIDPSSSLEKLSRCLKPGGLMVIEVPNFNSIFRLIHNEHWWYIQPYNHLYYFTKSTLKYLLEKLNLKIIFTEYTGGLGFADTYIEKNPNKELPYLFNNTILKNVKDAAKLMVNKLNISNVIRIYAKITS